MEVQAITKNVRMSAQKMREVVRQIQGLPAGHAFAALAATSRKGARFVAKTLSSAIANAEHLRDEWKEATLKQKIADLQGRVTNTRNHKRRNKYENQIEQYQDFLDSSSGLVPDEMIIKEALAQTASTLRRFTPKARGSAGPILKRSCHIKIVLSDE